MDHPHHLTDRIGTATVDLADPAVPVVAGSHRSLTLTYTAGFFGVDDTGSLKVVWRFASDLGKPQFDDPAAPNHVTAEASNGAVLELRFDPKMNVRPWDRTLYVKVVQGFLREGDTITVRFGDPRGGSPGMRMQTFCEDTFELRVLVDAFATYQYVGVPQQPEIAIVAGPPVRHVAVLPTLRRVGEPFRLGLKGEDRWGNPSDRCDATLRLVPSRPVAGLPERVQLVPGQKARVLDGLRVVEPGDLHIDVIDERAESDGQAAALAPARSNPLRIVAEAGLVTWWGDLHGQSEETIGTNSAEDWFSFGRDLAFLDAASHQGNDFQVTTPFWEHLNELTARFDEPGRFVAIPGYEWSGNTGLGGDRNVLYAAEGSPLVRSSHALVEDLSDLHTDANTAAELFDRLKGEDCVVFAHVGGRYADIDVAHDEQLETSVEVHSAWGTFEWLLHDAFRLGLRVGVVANSDGHKGRPGASHPGASKFGAYGGLTALLAPDLSRASVLDALRRRRHYGTTGCRLHLDVRLTWDGDDDARPAEALMGDVVSVPTTEAVLHLDVSAQAPIERVDLYDGSVHVETYRPYLPTSAPSRRIRLVWEGAEYRGRGRETVWDGSASLVGSSFARVEPLNRYNVAKPFEAGSDRVTWEALTTGGHGGFDAWLDDPSSGALTIDTALVQVEVPVADIGDDDLVFDAGGLDRRIRIFRLPEQNEHTTWTTARPVAVDPGAERRWWVRVTLEDGHLAWSSPIYASADPSPQR